MSRESDIIAAIGARDNERHRIDLEVESLRSRLTEQTDELIRVRVAAEARVAHLEGALREIADEPSIRTYNEIAIRHTCPDVASAALAASPTPTEGTDG